MENLIYSIISALMCKEIIAALVGGLSGGFAAGIFAHRYNIKLRDEDKKEKQDIYRSAMRLVVDDLAEEHEENVEYNTEVLDVWDNAQNPIRSNKRVYNTTLIPEGINPEYWLDQSQLGKGAADLYRLNVLLKEHNST